MTNEVQVHTLGTVKAALKHKALNPENVAYLERMAEKLQRGKHLTPNEVQGLAKIERALQHVTKGTYNKVS